MHIRKSWWRASMISGGAASLLSAVVASWLSQRRSHAPLATLNAVSHWLYGARAYSANGPSLRYTVPGVVIHHASSLFWAALYQLLLRRTVDRDAGLDDRPANTGPAAAADRWTTAAVVTAVAAFTDLRLVPARLSPGFEHRLSKAGVALVYVGFACGLALGARRPGRASSEASR